MRRPKAFGDLADLPATMTVPDAGRRGWGLSRAKAYELAAAGQFPCQVQRLGSRLVVRAADLLRALGLDPEAVLLGVRGDGSSTSRAVRLDGPTGKADQ